MSWFFFRRMKYSRNILPRKNNFGKKFPVSGTVTGGNFLSQEEIPCLRKKLPVEGSSFPSLDNISCHRKKITVTWRHSLSQEEFSSQKTILQAIGRNFLLQEEISCHRGHLYVLSCIHFLGFLVIQIFLKNYIIMYLEISDFFTPLPPSGTLSPIVPDFCRHCLLVEPGLTECWFSVCGVSAYLR